LPPSRAVGWQVVLAALLSAGCRQLLSVDDYSAEPAKKPIAQEPAAPGPEPTRAFQSLSPGCQSCISKHCADELSVCNDQPECVRLSACNERGLGPAWFATCAVQHVDAATMFQAAARCALTECVGACDVGQRFSCLSAPGVMPVPVADTLKEDITVVNFLATNEPLTGVRVRACQRLGWANPSCDASIAAEGETDESGRASLELSYPLVSVKQPWDGYLLATGPGLMPELRIFSTPRTYDIQYRYGVITEATYDYLTTLLHVVREPNEGDIGVGVYDCNLAPAPGIRVELEPMAPGVRRAYSTGFIEFDENLTETQSEGSVVFSKVPAGKPVKIRATVAATGELLNELEVPVVAGVRVGVALEPQVMLP
jgi:hypothetical protein